MIFRPILWPTPAKAAIASGLSIGYRQADYLRDDLPDGQDLVTMIYGDFCAMPPDKRRLILDKVRVALKPNGVFVFDVFSTGMFAELSECAIFEARLMNGFWAGGATAFAVIARP